MTSTFVDVRPDDARRAQASITSGVAVPADLEPALRNLVKQGLIRRVREGLGGSHTVVTYPPLDALERVDTKSMPISPVSAVNLYFHVAFCEFICPFCHYAKTYSGIGRDSELVTEYVKALSTEIATRKQQLADTPVESIYIGGGTPTSLSAKLIEELVTNVLSLSSGTPPNFCVETSPLTIVDVEGREKIRLLQSLGVNRFSMGVQTFNDATLRRLRGHSREVLMSALDEMLASGAQFNVDLIQDLPGQTRATIDDDLACIDRYRPHQVTWYMLRFHDEASWYKLYSRGDLHEIPDDVESALRRIQIRRTMVSLGYSSQPGGRFVRAVEMPDVYKSVRGGTEGALLGFGVSAYSHGWGWFFRNVTQSGKSGITEYNRRMRRGDSPVEYAFELTPDERKAGRLVTGIRTGVDPEWLVGDDEATTTAYRIVSKLREQGLLASNTAGSLVLSELGSAFEEEIASLFYSPAVRRRLAERDAYWATSQSPIV